MKKMSIQTRFRKNARAMTLIEVLLVISVVSLLSVSIYQLLTAGIRVWHRNQQLLVEEDVVIFLDKLAHDLNNICRFSILKTKGSFSQFSFPTIIYKPQDETLQTAGQFQLGQVKYELDYDNRTILRREADYGQALRQEWGKESILVENVTGLNFHYSYLSDNKEIRKDAIEDIIPYAVEVEISFMDGKEERILKKLILTPLIL